MANKLGGVVAKSKGKQKPIPVKIVYDEPKGLSIAPRPGGIDKYDAQEALRVMQRAAEIQNNKPLMRAAKAEAKAQIKQLSTVCKR